MADKNLDGNGLSEVWVRAAQLVKKYTGAVDSTKGDLQTQVNEKLSGTDDTKDNTVTFTSADESNPTAWKDVATLDSKEKHSSILNKISNMFSNIRYLYKNVGGIKGLSSSSAITTQGQYALDAREKNASVEGTLANQISNLNSNLGTVTELASLDSGISWRWFRNIDLSEYHYIAACAVINGSIRNISMIPVSLFRQNTSSSPLYVEIIDYESQKCEQILFGMSSGAIGIYNNRTPITKAVGKLYGIK